MVPRRLRYSQHPISFCCKAFVELCIMAFGYRSLYSIGNYAKVHAPDTEAFDIAKQIGNKQHGLLLPCRRQTNRNIDKL